MRGTTITSTISGVVSALTLLKVDIDGHRKSMRAMFCGGN